ncbi:unnamed protein product [Owenia fusiformis]|uniref:CST complex subunit CTC1 n=1 Tax=Owenia fusiformis TaxID=6347 RepID=A0A8J1XVD8_OWEFU|nr:unnamed protein product [Owenia fusiformis]
MAEGKQTTVECIDIKDARTALYNKELLHLSTVNVRGTVDVLSTVIRVKSDDCFLIKLTQESKGSQIFVLFKEKKHLKWHNFLEPLSSYVFINLKPTTLYKGSSSEKKVYVPWSKFKIHRENDCLSTSLDLQSWCEKHCGMQEHDGQLDLDVLASDTPDSFSEDSQKMYSYEGTISSCSLEHHGIYDLDNKIRLYSWMIERPCGMALGAKITVFNCHHRGSSKAPKIQLHCCLQSCIKVHISSSSSSRKRHIDDSISKQKDSLCINLALQYNFTFPAFQTAVEIFESLKKKFHPKYKWIRIDAILRKVLKITSMGDCMNDENPPIRNRILEFIQHDCIFQKTMNMSETSKLACLSDIVTSEHIIDSMRLVENDGTYWSAHKSDYGKQPWPLVGILAVSTKSGRIQLVDQTGSIDCIIAPNDPPKDSDDTPHECHKSCDVSVKCPYCHIKSLGTVIIVEEYNLVRETFQHKSPGHQDPAMQQDLSYKHVQFSMKNVTPLLSFKNDEMEAPLFNKKSKSDFAAESSGREALQKRGDSRTELVSQIFCLVSKDYLTLKTRGSPSPQLSFYINVILVGQPITSTGDHDPHLQVEEETFEGQAGVKHDNSGKSGLKSHINKEQLHVKGLHQSQYGVHRGQGQSQLKGQTKTTVQHNTRVMSILLSGDYVQWYHLLQHGCFYKLVMQRRTHQQYFKEPVSDPSLRTAMRACKTKPCVTLPPGVTLGCVSTCPCWTTIVGCNSAEDTCPEDCLVQQSLHGCDNKDVDPQVVALYKNSQCIHTVKDINTGKSKDILNFEGIVLSRSFVDANNTYNLSKQNITLNNQLNVSVPGNKCLRLLIKDLISSEEIMIYAKLENGSYPLGLLRGARVQFFNIERRVSKSGRAYCNFIVTSSFKIICTSPTEVVPILQQTDWSNAPYKKLNQLLDPSESYKVFQNICNVQQVLKIHLRTACNKCANVHKNGRCTYAPCYSGEQPKFKGRASVIVEDGTNTVILYVNDDLIRNLLGLKEQLWIELKQHIMDKGEYVYDREEEFTRSALGRLCNSPLVKRKLVFMCKPYSGFHGDMSDKQKCGGIHNKEITEFNKKITEGIETRNLPLIHLYCQDIKEVDFHSWGQNLLEV